MKKKNFLKTIAIAGVFAVATSANAQVVLTKTLPPIGTTYELWGNTSLPNTTAVPDTGANITWDYSTISTTYNNDIIIRGLSEVPSSEQTAVPNAVYVEEQILPGAPNTDWLPRVFFQDNGDFLIEIGKKNFGTTSPVLGSDTVFEFNLPYQSSTLVNLGTTGGGSGNFEYAGYGTLIIGSDTYNDVAMFKKDFTMGSVNGSVFYFYTLTPHYHRLARIFFYDGNVVAPGINYFKPTGATSAPPAAPSNLTVTPVNSMDLNWQDNSNDEDGFYIESTQDTVAGNWIQIASLGADVTYYHHTGLNPGEDYFYRVRAYNSNGNSAYSNIAGATELVTGIADFDNVFNTLIVYPNPANEFVTLTNIPNGSTVKILDVTGKVVYSSATTNDQTTAINMIDFKNGIYLIRIDNNGNIANRKLVVNK